MCRDFQNVTDEHNQSRDVTTSFIWTGMCKIKISETHEKLK